MGSAFPSRQVPAPDRIALLRGRIEPLLEIQRRFSRTISVSGEIDAELPYHGLPLGCVHEVCGSSLACETAFASLLSARISAASGQIVYATSDRSVYPLGLLPYGIQLDRWIHVSVRRSQDLAWAVLEALRCPQVSAVLAVMKTADLTLCRRFQLAAEGSGATGFLLDSAASKSATSIASVITRWQISSVKAPPGSSFTEPCWEIGLSYCRGGRPGQWTTVWRNGQLELLVSPSQATAPKPAQRMQLVYPNTLAG